ncbi:MAG: methionine biosynthesis protein MetW [Endomicrobiales bacterium]|nr:methionine biosynthesis protein MetW [Endomicrobiales bacterium]
MRIDHEIIESIIEPGSKVLDLGCGEGELLKNLAEKKNAKVQGIELDENAIYKCVEKGLSVYHSDIDTGLKGYPDRSFDYVILNQSLQQVKNVDYVINEAFRAGKKVIVGFPNFAQVKSRLILFFSGRAPVTNALPFKWNTTPNLRFWSIKDFKEFCRESGIKVVSEYFYDNGGPVRILPNVFALGGIFVLEK